MQIIKQKRTYWRVEPGSTDQPYATLELTSGFADGNWQYGWHVRLRSPDGKVTGHGGVYATPKMASTVAIELLTR